MCTISPRPNRRGRGHPVCAIYEKKARTFVRALLKYGGEGGLTRLLALGSPLTAFTVCPTGCRQLSTPVGASHPRCVQYTKSPYFRTSSSLNMAVRGIDSLRSPAGARSLRSRSVQLAVASCRTPVGASSPGVCNIRKSPYFRTSSS